MRVATHRKFSLRDRTALWALLLVLLLTSARRKAILGTAMQQRSQPQCKCPGTQGGPSVLLFEGLLWPFLVKLWEEPHLFQLH